MPGIDQVKAPISGTDWALPDIAQRLVDSLWGKLKTPEIWKEYSVRDFPSVKANISNIMEYLRQNEHKQTKDCKESDLVYCNALDSVLETQINDWRLLLDENSTFTVMSIVNERNITGNSIVDISFVIFTVNS